ncbi:MAG: hypothetical protein WCQ99_02355 [Pseudomonadota bacterium]
MAKKQQIDFSQLGFRITDPDTWMLRLDKKHPAKKVIIQPDFVRKNIFHVLSGLSLRNSLQKVYLGKISSLEFLKELLVNIGVNRSCLVPDNKA